MSSPIPFLILASSPAARAGLHQTLTQRPDWQVVGQGMSSRDLEILLDARSPAIVLVDWQLPLHSQSAKAAPENIFHLLAALPGWRLQFPFAQVWFLVDHVFPCFLCLALQAGASGCLDYAEAQTENFVAALHEIDQGRMYFSPQLQALWHATLPSLPPLSLRQLAILAAFAQAPTQSTRFHAQRLHITPSSLRARRSQICKCLGVTTFATAVQLAVQQGWLPLDAH